jgi:hypothetical protein
MAVFFLAWTTWEVDNEHDKRLPYQGKQVPYYHDQAKLGSVATFS